jgi:hypothetical protein
MEGNTGIFRQKIESFTYCLVRFDFWLCSLEDLQKRSSHMITITSFIEVKLGQQHGRSFEKKTKAILSNSKKCCRNMGEKKGLI